MCDRLLRFIMYDPMDSDPVPLRTHERQISGQTGIGPSLAEDTPGPVFKVSVQRPTLVVLRQVHLDISE